MPLPSFDLPAARHSRRAKSPPRSVAACLTAAAAAAILVAACIPASPACADLPNAVEITVSATEMTPANVAVCRDDDVTLAVRAEVDGVLHVHGYDEQLPATEIASGETTQLRFTAARSGQFPIELHPADDPTGVAVGVLTVHEP